MATGTSDAVETDMDVSKKRHHLITSKTMAPSTVDRSGASELLVA